MQITDVTASSFRYVLDEPMADAIHYMPERVLVLVQVQTDSGLSGIGESACYGGDPASIAAMVEGELKQAILGEDPFEVERLWQRMASRSHQRGTRGAMMMAISGIDIALWDLIGRATNTPLYRLLGGYRSSLTAYASAGFYANQKSAEDLADEIGSYAERGFEWAKIKVGRNPDVMWNPLHNMIEPDFATASLEEDVERVRAVRKAVGPKMRLAIDANNAWTPPAALAFMEQVADCNIAWLEEPVGTEDRRGSADVARALNTPVSGYETETGLAGFRDLITGGAVDIVQPDAIWTGGITPCRKIAALAESYGLPVIPHVFSSGLATIANMHFIASIPNGGLLECDQNPNPLRSELFEEPITVGSDGKVQLPDGPGLGVKLNQKTLDRYRIA